MENPFDHLIKEEDNKLFQWLKNAAESSKIEQEKINHLRETNPSALPLGYPCKHPGCLHRTHPCEGCGRMHGQFTDEEDKSIGYIQDRYGRSVSGSVFHIGDCNFYNAHFPFCDCGLMRDLAPLEHNLALYIYPKFDEDFAKQMETRSISEEHFMTIEEQEVNNEKSRNQGT